jgi:hypothetical protein
MQRRMAWQVCLPMLLHDHGARCPRSPCSTGTGGLHHPGQTTAPCAEQDSFVMLSFADPARIS